VSWDVPQIAAFDMLEQDVVDVEKLVVLCAWWCEVEVHGSKKVWNRGALVVAQCIVDVNFVDVVLEDCVGQKQFVLRIVPELSHVFHKILGVVNIVQKLVGCASLDSRAYSYSTSGFYASIPLRSRRA
jgi:hypothetical protein